MADKYLQESVANLLNVFLNGMLQPIAAYVKENAHLFKDQPVENIVIALRAAGNIQPAPAVSHSMSSLGPSLPPALTSGALPSGFSGGGAPAAAPAKKGRASGGTGGKAAQALQRWLSPDQFRAEYQRQKLCAYLPNRGEHKGMICASTSVINPSDSNIMEYRCSVCKGKKGTIGAKFSASSGVTPHVSTGFNVPISIPTMAPPMPGMPSFASSMPDVPTSLPGFPAPSGMPGVPSLPAAPTALPGMPSIPTMPGASTVPSMPFLPGVPSMPPSVPTALPGVPPIPTLPSAQPIAMDHSGKASPQLTVIQIENFAGAFFVQDDAFRQLAIIEKGDDLICIGKVSGFKPTSDGDIPANWADSLAEPSAEDFAYLKARGVSYDLRNSGNPKPIA